MEFNKLNMGKEILIFVSIKNSLIENIYNWLKQFIEINLPIEEIELLQTSAWKLNKLKNMKV